MTKRMELKRQKRRATLFAHLSAHQCGAEGAGEIDEANDYEVLIEEAMEVLGRADLRDEFDLCLAIGAPPGPVDISGLLNRSQYSRHIDTPSIPSSLVTCFSCRNKRVRRFQFGDALRRSSLAKADFLLPSHRNENVRILMGLLATYGDKKRSLRQRGIPGVLRNEMTARRSEISAQKKSIKTCIAEVQSTTAAALWQRGHVEMLRDLASQDFETTGEQREGLCEVINLLRHYKSAP